MKILSADLVRYNANDRGKNVGDCVKRSLSLATGTSYAQISKELNAKVKEILPRSYANGREGLWRRASVYSKVIADHGGDEKSTKVDELITLQDFVDNELPAEGTFLVTTGSKPGSHSDHIVCIIDGKVYDSWDSRNQYVYSYYTFGDDVKLERKADVDVASMNDDQLDDLLQKFNFTDRLSTKIATMLAKKDYSGVNYQIRSPRLINYRITTKVELTFPPLVGLDKSRNYMFKIDIVASPFETEESLAKLVDKAINVRAYDRMYAVLQNEEQAKEAAALAQRIREGGSDKNKHRIDKQVTLFDSEARVFKSLPGWAQQLATYFDINQPGQFSDSYEIHLIPLPDDPYHDPDDTIRISAFDAAELRRQLDRYHETYKTDDDEYEW